MPRRSCIIAERYKYHDVVQAVLIRSKLVRGFFRPGEKRSNSVQVEPEQERIVRADLEFFEDTIPDSKYLDWMVQSSPGRFGNIWFRANCMI